LNQEHLGLFDTPPDRYEIRLGIAVAGVLFAALVFALPLRDLPLPEVVAFIPTIDAIMLVGELITATLLYSQAAVFRSRALVVLATGFAAAALLLIPHALPFPGAFATDGLLGAGVNSTAWIASFRRAAFPIAVILYVVLNRADSALQPAMERRPAGIGLGILSAVALAGAVTLLTTVGHDLLPSYFLNRSDLNYANAFAYQLVLFLLFVIAATMLFRARRSVLDMWLLVALAGWLTETFLVLALQSRFTAGWYALFIITLFSHLVVMLALIAESNRLYARLALATAAQKREREARLMSMDAVTAAIAHEAGQPLTAVSLEASAALNWLTQPRPDLTKVATSLRAISDANKRTFEVIKSVRAMFAKGTGGATEFDLNELVRETAHLLDREMTAAKISLAMSLDKKLPPIVADRVQIQRVLLNLLTNAIEAFGMTSGRGGGMALRESRVIGVRTRQSDGTDALVEVGDSGPGIAPEDLDRIFDPFVTTKASGTGLGLSLCQSIVEDHKGRLWASNGEAHGTVFHMTLPHSGRSAEREKSSVGGPAKV